MCDIDCFMFAVLCVSFIKTFVVCLRIFTHFQLMSPDFFTIHSSNLRFSCIYYEGELTTLSNIMCNFFFCSQVEYEVTILIPLKLFGFISKLKAINQ